MNSCSKLFHFQSSSDFNFLAFLTKNNGNRIKCNGTRATLSFGFLLLHSQPILGCSWCCCCCFSDLSGMINPTHNMNKYKCKIRSEMHGNGMDDALATMVDISGNGLPNHCESFSFPCTGQKSAYNIESGIKNISNNPKAIVTEATPRDLAIGWLVACL